MHGVDIYAAADAYALAFSYRDIPSEVDALVGWAGRGQPGRILELAAGPADHAIEFVRRGWVGTALDRSPAMCALAARRATQSGAKLTVVEADMRRFVLSDAVDLAIMMLDSASQLLTTPDLLANLRSVRSRLAPGGSYILELSYPTVEHEPSRTATEWDMAAADRRVHIAWGSPEDRYNPATRVTDVRVRLEYSVGPLTIEDVVPCRAWTEPEIRAAAEAAGFTVAGIYGDFDGVPLTDPAAWRMIVVLQSPGPLGRRGFVPRIH
jgi:SAM-dependent methyltransferase